MLRLTARQRGALGATIRELANYGVAALVFGQFIGQSAVSWWLVLAGMTLWLVLVSSALLMEGD